MAWWRWLADEYTRRQRDSGISSARAAGPFNAVAFEQRLGGGLGPHRLRAIALLWQATGPDGGDASSRAAAAELLARWAKHADPAVSAAAAWWSERDWTRQAATMRPERFADLEWARAAPADPVESWLVDLVPARLEWESRPSHTRAVHRPEAGLPEALRHPSRRDDWSAIQARMVEWDREGQVRWRVLREDDPFLLEAEAWLLSGADPALRWSDSQEAQAANRLLTVVERSLAFRAVRLRGTPSATRALDALEGLLRFRVADRPERSRSWRVHSWRVRSWRALEQGRASDALVRGEGPAAAGHAASALAHHLCWWWEREVARVVRRVENRPIRRSLFGFGSPRASITDEDLDLLQRHASERTETNVRMATADGLFFVAHVGSFGQRRRAKRLLLDLAADSDARLASVAQELLDAEFNRGRKDLDVEIVKALDAMSDAAQSLFGD